MSYWARTSKGGNQTTCQHKLPRYIVNPFVVNKSTAPSSRSLYPLAPRTWMNEWWVHRRCIINRQKDTMTITSPMRDRTSVQSTVQANLHVQTWDLIPKQGLRETVAILFRPRKAGGDWPYDSECHVSLSEGSWLGVHSSRLLPVMYFHKVDGTR